MIPYILLKQYGIILWRNYYLLRKYIVLWKGICIIRENSGMRPYFTVPKRNYPQKHRNYIQLIQKRLKELCRTFWILEKLTCVFFLLIFWCIIYWSLKASTKSLYYLWWWSSNFDGNVNIFRKFKSVNLKSIYITFNKWLHANNLARLISQNMTPLYEFIWTLCFATLEILN